MVRVSTRLPLTFPQARRGHLDSNGHVWSTVCDRRGHFKFPLVRFGLTRVLASEVTHAGVEQVSPHSAQLVQQVAAWDVVRIPKTLRLQALVMS